MGVVRQTETAALKAVGSNRGAPFERKLQQLYTKGTYVDEMLTSDMAADGGGSGGIGTTSSNYLLCVMEQNRGGSGTDEFVKTGIVVSKKKICMRIMVSQLFLFLFYFITIVGCTTFFWGYRL